MASVLPVLFQLIGGIGLFLLGMVLLTDGLKSFAGDSLRHALLRFTGRPVSAFASGVVVTALVQSSSATTLATIGFVSAGLLSFPQAIGVVFGASLGTTSTGWIVSTVGLKFSIGAFALPLTGVGAFMKLLGRGKIASLGLALAGFGLIFIGIDTLQDGMRDLAATFDLGRIPADGFFGYMVLMAIGIVMTVVMQSSSAAIATTLAALSAGAIGFEHAMALVIGQAIGTTVTAAIAAIGASIPARRTALAHVSFNVATGLIALLLLPVYRYLFELAEVRSGLPPGPVSLAAFHSSFILIGVVLFLPFTRPFARLIERILPDQGPQLTRNLDASLYEVPAVALEAATNSIRDIAGELIELTDAILHERDSAALPSNMERVNNALEETKRFLGKVPLAAGEEITGPHRIALFHALDHLSSLTRILPVFPREGTVRTDPAFTRFSARCMEVLRLARKALIDREAEALENLEQLSPEIAAERRRKRVTILEEVAAGGRDPDETLRLLDSIRWIDSTSYHLWRASAYLSR